MNINENVINIMNSISSLGYNVYLVGGAVRDLISKKEIHDYDLASDIHFEELAKLYRVQQFKENKNRNTVILKDRNNEIEITQLKGSNIIEDLSKRDFTINAIAIDSKMNIIDPYNGVKDINNKTIRVLDDNGEAFNKDPLRILRAIRFSATKEYNIDEKTKELMFKYKDRLNDIAPERILNEFNQILMVDKPVKYIKENKEIFFEIIPELKETDGFQQHNDYHIYDVFNHLLKVLDSTPKDLDLRYTALFHDIGKPKVFHQDENGIGHFYGHDTISNEIFKNFANKYRIPKYNKELISKLILLHEKPLSNEEIKIKRFLQKFGTNEHELDLLFLIKKADALGQNPKYLDRLDYYDKLKKLYMEIIHEIPTLKVRDLEINGNDLINMGYYGEEIGIILKELLDKVIVGELKNEKEALYNYLNREKAKSR